METAGVSGVVVVDDLAPSQSAERRRAGERRSEKLRQQLGSPIRNAVSGLDQPAGGAASSGATGGVVPHIFPARSEDVEIMMQANPLRQRPTEVASVKKEAWFCDYCRAAFDSFAEAHVHEATCPVFCDFSNPTAGALTYPKAPALEMQVGPGNVDVDEDEGTMKRPTCLMVMKWMKFAMKRESLAFFACLMVIITIIAVVPYGGGSPSAALIDSIVQNVEMDLTSEQYHTVQLTLETGYGVSIGIVEEAPGNNFISLPGTSIQSSAHAARRGGLWVTFDARISADADTGDVNVKQKAEELDLQVLLRNMDQAAAVYGTAQSMPAAGSTFLGDLTVTQITKGSPTAAPTSPPTFAPDITRAPTPPTPVPTAYPTTIPTPLLTLTPESRPTSAPAPTAALQ